MKKKAIFVIIALVLYTSFLPLFPFDEVVATPVFDGAQIKGAPMLELDVSARAAALIGPNGELLFEKNGSERLGIASTTKIMTAITVIECCDMDEEVVIPKEAVGVEGSSLYLKVGERLTVEELLYGLLLRSGHDAAVSLAIHCAGTEAGFVEKMNEKASSLGLVDTHFENPHGLSSEAHYSTAIELGQLTAYALKNETFRKIASTYTHKIRYDGNEGGRLLINHNKLLKTYDGAIGVKTGFTKATGRTLVGAAERDGLTLISVTLDDHDDWRDHHTLLDEGFSAFELFEPAKKGELSFNVALSGGEKESVAVKNEYITPFIVRKGAEISTRFILPDVLGAPVSKGTKVGEVEYYCDGVLLGKLGLYTTESIDQRRLSFWERLKNERNKDTKGDQ